MPLFESQTSRNERWFGGMQYAVHKIFAEEFGHEPELAAHLAWAEGGMHVARFGVEHLATLKKAWGKGSLESAHALTTTFTLNMISRWYRAMRGDRPIKDETRAVQIAATNILTLLGQEALGDIVDFVNLHTQFIYECDWVEGKTPATGHRVEIAPGRAVEITPSESPYWGDVFQNPLAYELSQEQLDYLLELVKLQVKAFTILDVTPSKERPGLIAWSYQLIMDKALVACGHAPTIDWRMQTFPVEKHDDLRWLPGRHLPDTVMDDFGMWLALVNDAQEKMFKTHELLREEAAT